MPKWIFEVEISVESNTFDYAEFLVKEMLEMGESEVFGWGRETPSVRITNVAEAREDCRICPKCGRCQSCDDALCKCNKEG